MGNSCSLICIQKTEGYLITRVDILYNLPGTRIDALFQLKAIDHPT